ncbi:MAG: heme exporter protein CcmD [Gammaproteobacteria bacterium]
MTDSGFFAMGGYGFYVWGSYGVTALFMIVEVILILRRKRTILQRLGRIRRMTEKVKNETQT